MKHVLVALAAAVEAASAALLSVVVLAVPVLLMWLTTFNLESKTLTLVATIAAGWLLGHTVPLQIVIPAEQAFAVGAGNLAYTVPLSLPLAGLLCITLLCGFRAGRKHVRAAGQNWKLLGTGILGSTAGFAIAAGVITGFGRDLSTQPVWWIFLKPVLWFIAALAVGVLWEKREEFALLYEDQVVRRARSKSGALEQIVLAAQASLRIAAGVVAAFIAVAATATVLTIVLHYTEYVAVSESLHPDLMGVLALFILHLLLLPVFIVWAFAWLTGNGVVVGADTLFSPFSVITGPVPALPGIGLLPDSWGSWGIVAPLLLTIAASIVGYFVAFWLRDFAKDWQRLIAIIFASLLVYAVSLLLFGTAVGALGPGRLAVTGAAPFVCAAGAAGLAFLGLCFGVFIPRPEKLKALFAEREAAQSGSQREAIGSAEAQTTDITVTWAQSATAVEQNNSAENETLPVVAAPDSESQVAADTADYEPLSTVAAKLDEAETLAETEQYDTAELLKEFEWQPAETSLASQAEQDLKDAQKRNL